MDAAWRALLDDYEAVIANVRHALRSGDLENAVAGWEPPADGPTVAPSAADVARFRHLQDQAEDCRRLLRQRLGETGRELTESRERRKVHHAYGANDRRSR